MSTSPSVTDEKDQNNRRFEGEKTLNHQSTNFNESEESNVWKSILIQEGQNGTHKKLL
jgi:hypothetical protein